MVTSKHYASSHAHHAAENRTTTHGHAGQYKPETTATCFLLQSEKDALLNFMLNAPIKEVLHKDEQKTALSLINKLLTSSPVTGSNGLNLPERFDPKNLNHWVVIALMGVALTLSVAFIIFFGFFFLKSLASIYPNLTLKTDTHLMAAMIGVPLSALLGLIIVGLFGWMTKSADGFTLELGMLRFGVQGATGPLILWLACFFVLSYAFHSAFYPSRSYFMQERTEPQAAVAKATEVQPTLEASAPEAPTPETTPNAETPLEVAPEAHREEALTTTEASPSGL
jgi:hypothetical protein